jgi:xylulokinase
MGFLLGLDIGTTTIKAVLYDPSTGKLNRQASQPTPINHPSPEKSQHDPDQLWQAICRCLMEVSQGQPIDALAISSFAEAGLPLNEHGNALHPIIAWFDQRTAPQAEWWKTRISIEDLYSITGQRLSPSFGVNKLLWIREHHPEAISGMKQWLSSSDFVFFQLTGEVATDYSQASRTMLFDQQKLGWSEKMLELSGLAANQLPHIGCAGTVAGKVTREASAQTGLPEGLPCVLGGHDHLCAAFAAGATQPGVVIDSMGTSQSALVAVDQFQTNLEVVRHGFVCYAHVVSGLYILKAGIHAAGGAIEWLAGLLSSTGEKNCPIPYEELEMEAQTGIGRNIGPLWLPHFIGSGTPEMDWNSRAALVGARIDHTRGDIMRGLWESQAFWLKHNLDEMGKLSGQPVERVILLGGTTRLQLLSRLKASILNLPMLLPALSESAATGAALLAGLGIGSFTSPAEAQHSLKIETKLIEPQPELAAWYLPIYEKIYRQLYPNLKIISEQMHILEGK